MKFDARFEVQAKIFRHNPFVLFEHVVALVTPFVSILAELHLPSSASLFKRKDRR